MTKSSWTKYDSAYDAIVDTYDIETLNEIVNHGCQSGVANSHIYYKDTVEFFNTFEEELVDYIETNLGEDVLVDLFKGANCDLDCYKNDVTWCYIELVSSQIVDTDNEELAS
tara:strand:+ start:644 stop:979 length:336 start_codon:yes stop_codon:yes gene_type:complete